MGRCPETVARRVNGYCRVAERLMTDQGYNATSLDQVIAESSSSKGAFFHHFSSKADLAVQLVERYVASDLAHLDAGLAATAEIEDPADRVVGVPAVLRGRRRRTDGRAVRMPLRHRARRAGVHRNRDQPPSRQGGAGVALRHSSTCFARRWRTSTRRIDIEALADHLFTTFEGGFILCRTLENPSAMQRQLRTFRQLVEALLLAHPSNRASPGPTAGADARNESN